MTTLEILQNTDLALVRPEITVYETEKEIFLEAEMPGVAKDKISVTLEEDQLVISGRREWNLPEKAVVLQQESFPVEYYRDLAIGRDVQRDSISAGYENGILRVRFLKVEKAAPKKISVQ